MSVNKVKDEFLMDFGNKQDTGTTSLFDDLQDLNSASENQNAQESLSFDFNQTTASQTSTDLVFGHMQNALGGLFGELNELSFATQSSNNQETLGFDFTSTSSPQTDTQLDLISDMNTLNTTVSEQVEVNNSVEDSDNNCSVGDFIYNIESLLPEYEKYFQQNKNNIFEKLSDQSELDEISTNNQFYDLNGVDEIKFRNDDEMIEAILGYLTVNTLMDRMDVILKSYRHKLIALYEQSESSVKTLDLPVIQITQSKSNPKPEIIEKPKEFLEAMKHKELYELFMDNLKSVDWTKMTKASFDKLIDIMRSSKSEKDKSIYEQLEKNGLVQVKPGGNYSYKISTKV